MELSSKATVLWILVLVAVVAAGILLFAYFQGGLSHAVPQ